MARIVVGCWGSHGDFDPSLGLALGLKARGHDVVIATLSYFEPHVREAGLEFAAIRPDVSPNDAELVARIMHPVKGTEELLRGIVYPGVPAMYEDLAPLARSADLLVSHPLTMPIPILAAELGKPWASTVLAPMSFFSATDIPVIPGATFLKSLDALGSWPGAVIRSMGDVMSRSWARPVYELRERHGLARGPNPIFAGQHSPHLVLALYSRVLGAPQSDWPANVEITGHMFHDAAHGTALAPAVEAFLANGPAPVLFTLGSSAVLSPGTFWGESIKAARMLGARAILLAGPGGPEKLRAARGVDSLGPDILALEFAPHSLLMPRASAIVMQCGIGTLAQGLRSGAPILAVPFAHDQPDNAHRAMKLGLARILPPKRYTAVTAQRELGALLSDPSYHAAAQRVSAEVKQERGVDAACDALERLLARR